MTDDPIRWRLRRYEDVHDVSGTGIVVTGTVFPDGKVAYRWTTEPSTTQLADDISHVRSIHGHEGRTIIEWIDEPTDELLDQADHITNEAL